MRWRLRLLLIPHAWRPSVCVLLADQAAVIKRQLISMLRGVSIFLDVDDLDDVGDIEAHVQQSLLFVCFLSRGYFLSEPCLREVRLAKGKGKPILAVHEQDITKGGAALHDLIDTCPEGLRDSVFDNGTPLVPWLRSSAMQRASLALIAEHILLSHRAAAASTHRSSMRHNDPSRHTSQSDCEDDIPYLMFTGGTANLIYTPHVFTQPRGPVLYVSPHNPGAAELADLLVRATVGLRVVHTPLPVGSVDSVPHLDRTRSREGRLSLTGMGSLSELSGSRGSESPRASRRRSSSLSQRSSTSHSDGERSQTALDGALQEFSHVLLYLNMDTFMEDSGMRLNAELRVIMGSAPYKARRLCILLVHEMRPECGGCEFDRFFHVCPPDLIKPPGDLFKTIAIGLHAHERHLAVALSQMALRLGAIAKPSSARGSTPPQPSPFDAAWQFRHNLDAHVAAAPENARDKRSSAIRQAMRKLRFTKFLRNSSERGPKTEMTPASEPTAGLVVEHTAEVAGIATAARPIITVRAQRLTPYCVQ